MLLIVTPYSQPLLTQIDQTSNESGYSESIKVSQKVCGNNRLILAMRQVNTFTSVGVEWCNG